MSPLCDGSPDGRGAHRVNSYGWCDGCGFTIDDRPRLVRTRDEINAKIAAAAPLLERLEREFCLAVSQRGRVMMWWYSRLYLIGYEAQMQIGWNGQGGANS